MRRKELEVAGVEVALSQVYQLLKVCSGCISQHIFILNSRHFLTNQDDCDKEDWRNAAMDASLHAHGCEMLARLHAKFDATLGRCAIIETVKIGQPYISDATWTIEMERLLYWLDVLQEEAMGLYARINRSFDNIKR